MGRTAAGFLGALAAAGALAAGAAGAASPDALMAHELALIGQLAPIVQADAADCARMAADVEAWAKAHGAEVRRFKAGMRALRSTQRIAVQAKYGPRIAQLESRIGGSVQQCSSNPAVLAALKLIG
jgi:hypothetical protein